ncbi:MAG: enoyl-CoA hydratase/isomerase [Hyphomonadaceae bacterium]|nr:enoyl-CoA hydratase/isomerase [Hyphomonadaceae bacterium]
MAYSKIKAAVEGDVLVITLSDPGTLNAVTTDMAGEISAAIEAHASARCLVLTGEGRAFCSGANLTNVAMPIAEDGGADPGLSLEQHYNPLMTKLRDLPIPFITAVNGAAAGIGCSLALMGDLIVAGESAYFLQAFRRIGLAPDGGATYLLPRMLTRVQAMEMMLLGEKLPAAKALQWGLINRCVADGEVISTAMALASELARGPTKALAITRKLAWDALDNQWSAQLNAERWAQREAGRTSDFAEGVTAFLQKRPAQFRGN